MSLSSPLKIVVKCSHCAEPRSIELIKLDEYLDFKLNCLKCQKLLGISIESKKEEEITPAPSSENQKMKKYLLIRRLAAGNPSGDLKIWMIPYTDPEDCEKKILKEIDRIYQEFNRRIYKDRILKHLQENQDWATLYLTMLAQNKTGIEILRTLKEKDFSKTLKMLPTTVWNKSYAGFNFKLPITAIRFAVDYTSEYYYYLEFIEDSDNESSINILGKN